MVADGFPSKNPHFSTSLAKILCRFPSRFHGAFDARLLETENFPVDRNKKLIKTMNYQFSINK